MSALTEEERQQFISLLVKIINRAEEYQRKWSWNSAKNSAAYRINESGVWYVFSLCRRFISYAMGMPIFHIGYF
jgi:hypothetical protein